MAGHSQFKNIMHRKGAQDARRGRQFARLIREITVAVIARLRLRLLYRLSTTQLISGRYPLRLQHRPQLLLLDS